ncbi:MAG: RnfABCDGE type electron transport complex subunit D [Hydrogenophilus sp.]|nr:RnfABCDGE type electron transport complex subunit D [Hydrogenophilus sp.]
MTTIPVHAPHAHAATSIGQQMAAVAIALTPATLAAFWLFGWPTIYLWLLAILSALAAEALALRVRRQPVVATLKDGSALLTGWLLALSLPPWGPWWLAVIGSFFAILVVKAPYGGLGQNLFNPAMAARVALLISFPVEMTHWVAPLPLTEPAAPNPWEALLITFGSGVDAVSSASLLGQFKTALTTQPAAAAPSFDLAAHLIGLRPGSSGETVSLLLAAGGVWLLAKGVITWPIPVGLLVGLLLPATVAHLLDPARHLAPLAHLFSGGLLLAAFFIATDPVTSPNSSMGQLLFGLGVGLLTWLIRAFGGYPEGVAFAVLLMNAATPLIDRFVRPRIFGRDRRGRPLPTSPEAR